MSLYTDGNASRQLDPGSVYPGEIDPTLRKGDDVHYYAGPRIVLSENMAGSQLVSLLNAKQMAARKLPIMRWGTM